tara:strand:- start:36209 stop:36841 length:633 start_codon:yes stop_codon:yes gene_type:complete
MLHNERKEYTREHLDIENCPNTPIELLQQWIDRAVEEKIPDATAFTLSTIDLLGWPRSRVVLLKYLDQNQGLTFFTNYTSQKAKDIGGNRNVSLNFFWKEHERQVRILGVAEKCGDQCSDDYFYSRPKESRVGAIISNQSSCLESRADLRKKFNELNSKDISELKRPFHWGGYNIKPHYFEFWQGGAHRLHDRVVYKKEGVSWSKLMLQP